jgi:hypothetical protein
MVFAGGASEKVTCRGVPQQDVTGRDEPLVPGTHGEQRRRSKGRNDGRWGDEERVGAFPEPAANRYAGYEVQPRDGRF